MPTSTTTLNDALDFALDAAWQAGRISQRYFQTGLAVERKGDDSPVTQADRETEQYLRERIARTWPGDGILGEEFGHEPGKNGLTWVIDPIDGTKSFICGVPFYACLLALVDADKTPLVGVMHFPALDETAYATRGGGAFWNGRRTRVSSVSRMADAVLLASEIVVPDEKQAGWQRLLDATWIHRTWGDAYGYLLVATGRAEIMLDTKMNLWDCAPLGVILPEAGGTFTDWLGRNTIDGGNSIGTNGALYDAVMRCVHGEQA